MFSVSHEVKFLSKKGVSIIFRSVFHFPFQIVISVNSVCFSVIAEIIAPM